MPSRTPNLNLYKVNGETDGNETFNVDVVLNDNWDKIDGAVKAIEDAVGEITVPDASLTQKGIVQLSSETNSTSEAMAATPKAVKAASDVAAAAQAKAEAAETPSGAQAKANTAEANAKLYIDTNFYKKDRVDSVNLVRNGSAIFGFQDWTISGGSWAYVQQDANIGGYFYPNQSITAGSHIFLESSDPIAVFANANYYLGCTFHTNEGLDTDLVRVEVINATNGIVLGSLYAANRQWWHRRTAAITIPADVVSVKLRLVVTGPITNAAKVVRGFGRITFSIGSADTYGTQGDMYSIFQSVANGKSSIATAISGKGIPTSPTDPFATMAANINLINTGKKWAKGQIRVEPTTGYGSVTGLNFTPSNIILVTPSWSGVQDSYVMIYSTDAPTNGGVFQLFRGINNGAGGSGQHPITVGSGYFNVSVTLGYGGTYNYFATE
ncbi:hypothetical protein BK138_29340 [Paenibacillus rhizosphaerae]|uniref:Phage tail protein n=1 Tax=Paenibacillus rhizosphaerae TaxID=297318 RepID=A0A1R1ECP2_9BACL|nr:phage tail protein [Paenibacillus rhizosphaerae]OMF49588.1 hypothetical protein BK138_29340 [Paenibacillus rhizosphaerae]